MTPEEEEQVRRALADARASRSAIPSEVTNRLDDRLAELVEERSRLLSTADAAGTGSPDRPRRRWPQALLAAAAVVVVVVGGGFLLRQITSGDGLSAASGPTESRANASGGSGRAAGSAAQPAPGPVIHHSAVSLHTTSLRHDVRGYLDHSSFLEAPALSAHVPNSQPTTAPTTKPTRAPTGKSANQLSGAYPSAGCASPAHDSADRVVGAFLDGRPATLVVRAPQDGIRVVQVYSCADPATPVAATTLPARPVQPAR